MLHFTVCHVYLENKLLKTFFSFFFPLSLFLSLVNFGERLEATPLWPLVRVYFQMTNWILNYRIDDASQPCEFDPISSEVYSLLKKMQ